MSMPDYCQTVASESVSAGHPDKVADQISDAILDAALSSRRDAHVACETVVSRNRIAIYGEVSQDVIDQIDFKGIARRTVAEIGYTDSEIGMDA